MSSYDNRDIRTLALPMTPRERSGVVSMLLGWSAPGVSAGMVALLREVGITVKQLNSGQRYIESVEA